MAVKFYRTEGVDNVELGRSVEQALTWMGVYVSGGQHERVTGRTEADRSFRPVFDPDNGVTAFRVFYGLAKRGVPKKDVKERADAYLMVKGSDGSRNPELVEAFYEVLNSAYSEHYEDLRRDGVTPRKRRD